MGGLFDKKVSLFQDFMAILRFATVENPIVLDTTEVHQINIQTSSDKFLQKAGLDGFLFVFVRAYNYVAIDQILRQYNTCRFQ